MKNTTIVLFLFGTLFENVQTIPDLNSKETIDGLIFGYGNFQPARDMASYRKRITGIRQSEIFKFREEADQTLILRLLEMKTEAYRRKISQQITI